MKFCYIDESGTGAEPFAVMVGIIVDSQRMHLTKKDWEDMLKSLSRIVGRTITEIHTRDFYSGSGPWRHIDGPKRAKIITAIFEWLLKRKHHIVYAAVDKAKFYADIRQEEPLASHIKTPWRFMALHITLALQRNFKTAEKTKGNTVLIFDNENREEKNYTELILKPPKWTDTYYGRNASEEPLNQIIDVPYFGDSQHVGLIQAADFICYFFRRYIELHEGVSDPKYDGEQDLLTKWISTALKQAIPKSCIYPSRSRCNCAELFYKYAPRCIL